LISFAFVGKKREPMTALFIERVEKTFEETGSG
jgi:hypothetical protein